MSTITFLLIVALIVIATFFSLIAMLLVIEYTFIRAQRMQSELLKALAVDDADLDQHAADNPDMQFYQN